MTEEHESISIDELLFSINHQICKEYPALSPYDVNDQKYGAVVQLYCDMRTLQIRQARASDPDRVIRRRAGDDWF